MEKQPKNVYRCLKIHYGSYYSRTSYNKRSRVYHRYISPTHTCECIWLMMQSATFPSCPTWRLNTAERAAHWSDHPIESLVDLDKFQSACERINLTGPVEKDGESADSRAGTYTDGVKDEDPTVRGPPTGQSSTSRSRRKAIKHESERDIM